MKRISKRIAQVTVKRMTDDSPDTSYLGEYSDRAKSEYAIDRAHSEDCQSLEANHFQTVDALERVIQYVDSQRTIEGENPDSIYWEAGVGIGCVKGTSGRKKPPTNLRSSRPRQCAARIFAPFTAEYQPGLEFGTLWQEWLSDLTVVVRELKGDQADSSNS